MELESVWRIRRKVKALEGKISALRDAQRNIVPIIDGLPKSHNVGGNSRLEEMANRILALEEELNAVKAEEVAAAAKLALEIIKRVPYPMADILIQRYVACQRFESIIGALCYSKSHVFRLHAQGVKKFKAKADATLTTPKILERKTETTRTENFAQ